jgi:hypothetical protein
MVAEVGVSAQRSANCSLAKGQSLREDAGMRHLLLFVAALPWMVVLASPAQAGWYEFWYGAKRDHRQNHAWPEPFAARDRQAVAAPFDAMVRAGWRSQTTLGTHDFDPETQSLNEAGERRLRWMATQAPEPYRTIYVAQGRDQATAERRLESVQQALPRVLGDQPVPPVVATVREPRNWSADEVNTIERRLQSSVPSPRLPDFKPAGSLTQGQ